jgi:4'-phosphopantetheinyl transferase
MMNTTALTALSQCPVVYYGVAAEFPFAGWLPLLNGQEQQQAGSYSRTEDAQCYIAARAALRFLLAALLKTDARQLEFGYGRNGKPFLLNDNSVEFNVSHSGNVFLIGLSAGKEIGVDIECLSRKPSILKIQPVLYAPSELRNFSAIEPAFQNEAFLDYWTKKEAMLKMTGDGVAEMNRLELPINMAEATKSSFERYLPEQDCFLKSCTILQNYRVSVAVKGKAEDVRILKLKEPFTGFTKQKECCL